MAILWSPLVASSQDCWLQAGALHLPLAAESPMRGLGKEHTSFQESLEHGGQSDLGQPPGSLGASQMLISSAEVPHQRLETST